MDIKALRGCFSVMASSSQMYFRKMVEVFMDRLQSCSDQLAGLHGFVAQIG